MITATLTTPIPFFAKTITKIAWRVNYPENKMYYQLQDADDINLKDGNWEVPTEVIDTWVDDSTISDAVIAAAPWNAV